MNFKVIVPLRILRGLSLPFLHQGMPIFSHIRNVNDVCVRDYLFLAQLRPTANALGSFPHLFDLILVIIVLHTRLPSYFIFYS